MPWNDMTYEQMEAQLLRQAVTIGVYRAALEEIDRIATAHRKGAIGLAQTLARRAMKDAAAL